MNATGRMESSGEVGQVNISEATYALVKDAIMAEVGVASPEASGPRFDLDNDGVTVQRKRPAFTFTPRGKVQAKGKSAVAKGYGG